jgi:hypothetical protein
VSEGGRTQVLRLEGVIPLFGSVGEPGRAFRQCLDETDKNVDTADWAEFLKDKLVICESFTKGVIAPLGSVFRVGLLFTTSTAGADGTSCPTQCSTSFGTTTVP